MIGKTLENGQKKKKIKSLLSKDEGKMKPFSRKLVVAFLMKIVDYERWHLPAT